MLRCECFLVDQFMKTKGKVNQGSSNIKRFFNDFSAWARKRKSILNKLLILMVIIDVAVFAYILGQNQSLSLNKKEVKEETLLKTKFIFSTLTPTPTPTTVIFPMTKKTNIESDPVITCTIPEDCGGGTKKIKQSVCEQMTCCQVVNKWYLIPTEDTCRQLQALEAQLQKNQAINTAFWLGQKTMAESAAYMRGLNQGFWTYGH